MGSEVVAGRYELQGRLGDGWYGEVYRAHDRNLDHDVALKLLRGQPDTTSLLKEGAFLKSLESPYILRVENADIYDDIGYLATEIATGGSAEDQLNQRGMPPHRVLDLLRQILIGLRACHERGLIHCDVKPGNLFIHDSGHATLGDFGAADLMNARGEVRPGGDPQVRSPEMLKGGAGTVRSDIYSVGVTMYRLLSGRWPVPWPGDFKQLRDRVIVAGYEALADIAPHVPRSMTLCVRRAMALSPNQRFASAEAMSIALGRVDVGRRWTRIETHLGHDACWSDAPDGTPAREVCVETHAQSASITTRRATGARTRLVEHCRDGLAQKRLPIELRRIFATQ